MKKNLFLLIVTFIGFGALQAQDTNMFNYFLKGEVGTKSVLKVKTGSGATIGTEYYEITQKNVDCDTPFIQIKNYTTGLGNSAGIVYKVKSYNDSSYSELSEILNVERFLKSKVAELNPLWFPLPENLQVGDTLSGYYLVRHYSSYDLVTKVANRIIEGQETVSCPAGDFDCMKISYTIEAKTNYGVFISNYTDWLNIDVGIVKQEARTKSGNVENLFILQEVVKK